MKKDETAKRKVIAAGHRLKEQNYWLQKLSGEWVKSSFPGDRPRKTTAVSFQQIDFSLDGEEFSALLGLSSRSPHRLFMILTAQLMVLLYKYTGNTDILVGMPIYRQESEGDFINTTLPLRITFTPDTTFKELLLQVRQTVIEAVENQNYPMEVLLEKLNLPAASEDHGFPFFAVGALLEEIHEKKYFQSIDLDMVFDFRKLDAGLQAALEYDASLFSPALVTSIVGNYRRLLSQAAGMLDLAAADIEILSREEKQRLLFDFNDTAADFPMDKTIPQLFEEQVERTPDRIALVGPLSSAGSFTGSLTYRQLNEKSNRLARMFREMGVGTDMPVGLAMESPLERIIVILGILKAGGAYLPFDPAYPEQRVLSVLNESRSSLILTGSETLKKYSFTALQNLRWEADGKANLYLTPARPPIDDFDSLPLPDRRLIDHKKYSRYIGHAMVKNTISIQATRGCPYKCAYCHKIWPKTHVFRSAENLFNEVQFYYRQGMRKFAFVDDIFNLNINNSRRFFQLIIDNDMDVELFFPNGLRGDIMTEDYIDLMIQAGTMSIAFALETASPRLQKLIGKNLNLEKFRHNLEYIAKKHPHVNLELFTMIGFPTETEEEAMQTFDFMKSIKWLHFPYIFVLKIYPNTDMARLALDGGIPEQVIRRSITSAYHDLPDTLPFPKSFVLQYQTRFTNEYFLSKERLLHVLPAQMKICTEDELVLKYDDYLPMEINSFSDILAAAGISPAELGDVKLKQEDSSPFSHIQENLVASSVPADEHGEDAFRFLLLDVSHFFTAEKERLVRSMVIEPLGLMYLASYLNKQFGDRICCKIAQSRIDFDSYEELYALTTKFKPHLIGIRSLSYYREFFHRAVSYLKQRGVAAPIIAGGPYATSDYNFILQDPDVDLVVLGEGELTAAELVEKIMANGKKLPPAEVLETIRGIAFTREKDKIQRKALTREILLLDRLTGRIERCPGDNLKPLNTSNGASDLLYLISTSGSTGKPKIVMLEHRTLLNLLNFQYTPASTPIDFSDHVMQFASIGFDVSAQEIFSTLLAGGRLYPITSDMKGDIPRLLDFIQTNRISILYLPPAFLSFIFSRSEYAGEFPGSVKHIIAAGEQLTVSEPLKKYLQRNRVCLHNHYGPTETHVVTTLIIEPQQAPEELPPIGKPIANTRIYILDGNRRPQPLGVTGELYISGYNVGRGYCNDALLTAGKFMPDPFTPGERMYNTGDLAAWQPDGLLRFIGRKDNQVKIRGFRIELGEIENHLKEIDFIKESVVIDRQIANGDRYLCTYFVSDRQIDIAELREKLRRRLPDYMMPAFFVQLKKIPLTPNGKVDRSALPRPETLAADMSAAPRDKIEQKLVEIWADLLELEKESIGIDHNFFELGGHSLKATLLIARLHKEFNIKTSLGEIFERPTIRELAAVVKSAKQDIFLAVEAIEKREYYPLSSAQQRLYIRQQMKFDDTGYNLPILALLQGELDKEKLAAAFNKLIARHETLRTSFQVIKDEPAQRIHKISDIAFKIEYYELGGSQPTSIIGHFIRPFDLEYAPLLRVGLIKVQEQEHILMVDMHHIVTDATSLAVIAREFMQIYQGETLLHLRLQYRDYSCRQNRLLSSGEIKKQETYWLEQYAAAAPRQDLPLDFPRPAAVGGVGEAVLFEIDRELRTEIDRLIAGENTTLFIFLSTICYILLARYTRSEDIVIGTASEGRLHADLQSIVGMFVNTLPIRSRPAKEKTFLEFLKEVKENSIKAFDNQDYQFEELVDKLGLGGQTSRNPLFDVVFKVINNDIPEIEIEGLLFKPYDPGKLSSRFDLAITAIETGGMAADSRPMEMVMLFSIDLFKRSTIEDMAHHFIEIIRQALRNPRIKIKDIEISGRLAAAGTKLQQEETMFKF